MQELGLRIRAGEAADAAALRAEIATTLAHPDPGGRRSSYKGAAERGELMLLERYSPRERLWKVEGFVEYHLRVDDSLTIRDVGSSSDPPSAMAVKYLLRELFHAVSSASASLKAREDALAWREILESTPGFSVEGREYRRPHYYLIYQWSRATAQQQGRGPTRGRRLS
jgi:hypothetical protein